MKLLAAVCTLANPNTETPKRVEVMILGTYHMANPGLDYLKSDLDDHLSPRRQREIGELVARIAAFRPTKIMVEAVPTSKVNEQYRAYLDGTYRLTANETDQVAMRLAKSLGHGSLVPVDSKLDMDIEGVMKVAQELNDQSALKQMAGILSTIQREQSQRKTMTVCDIHLAANDPKWLAFGQGAYNRMLRVGTAENSKGADVVGGWYLRNVRIFANVARAIGPEDKRVLVLIGAGHAPILRQLVQDAPDMKLIEPSAYLRRRR